MNISQASREALHALLDIGLDTPPTKARVSVRTSVAYDRVGVDIYAPEFEDGDEPLASWWPPIESDIAVILTAVRIFLSDDNLAAVAASKRAARIAALEQQLAEAQAK